MLPKGHVVIPNNDIIEETNAGTIRKCAIACINAQRCIAFEFQSNSGIGKDCILRETFITNPEKFIPTSDRASFYLGKCTTKSSMTEIMNYEII